MATPARPTLSELGIAPVAAEDAAAYYLNYIGNSLNPGEDPVYEVTDAEGDRVYARGATAAEALLQAERAHGIKQERVIDETREPTLAPLEAAPAAIPLSAAEEIEPTGPAL